MYKTRESFIESPKKKSLFLSPCLRKNGRKRRGRKIKRKRAVILRYLQNSHGKKGEAVVGDVPVSRGQGSGLVVLVDGLRYIGRKDRHPGNYSF